MAPRPARSVLAFVLSGAVVAAIAGCGSSKHSTSSSSPATESSTASATPSAASASPADAATTTSVTNAFVTFFNGTAPIASRLALLQNATAFQTSLAAQASSPLISQTSATVSKVTLASPTQANVTYTVSLSGVPALSNQAGVAIEVDGSWKVAAVTFCALLTTAGVAPTACAQASVTALPS
jgi:hypothetical protein